MTPTHYTRRKLKSILKGNDYSLYHWSPLEQAKNIIKEGYIYSKATLFGLYYPDLGQLSHIKKNNALSEAKHGFTDYVFLGNTNWVAEGATCYYGEVCFVISPETVLPFKEFFVFPFNTGRNMSNVKDTQQVSDLNTLIQAFECQHRSYEVLIRRRVKISTRYIKEILCNSSVINSMSDVLTQNGIKGIPIKENHMRQNMKQNMKENFDTIELVDPIDNDQKSLLYRRGDFIQKDNMLYVRTSFSNCILQVEIAEDGNLIEVITRKQLGQIKEISQVFSK
jgi:hypothetical protein